MKISFLLVAMSIGMTNFAVATPLPEQTANAQQSSLSDLKNFQVNTEQMLSAGLPDEAEFQVLQEMGVTHVIDLIPGDRGDEPDTVQQLGLNYHNIAVDWHNPTLANFQDYETTLTAALAEEGKVLTHCKLNWRGAAFTYLYRITVLQENEKEAKQDLLAIWQPNQTWFEFMNTVLDAYNAKHGTSVSTTVIPSGME